MMDIVPPYPPPPPPPPPTVDLWMNWDGLPIMILAIAAIGLAITLIKPFKDHSTNRLAAMLFVGSMILVSLVAIAHDDYVVDGNFNRMAGALALTAVVVVFVTFLHLVRWIIWRLSGGNRV